VSKRTIVEGNIKTGGDNLEAGNITVDNTLAGTSNMVNNEAEKNNAGSGHAGHGSHEECIAAGQITYLTDGLHELNARIAKLEAMIANLDNNSGSSSALIKDSSKIAVQQVNNVAKQIEILSEALRTTPDYNLGKTFSCASCSATGTVAIRIRCTNCGKENWWGYWPKKNVDK